MPQSHLATTACFTLVASHVFRKDLERLPPEIRPHVRRALEELKEDPLEGPNIKKLEAEKIGRWRLRVGHYRIRYDIEGHTVVLHTCRHRRDAYREG